MSKLWLIVLLVNGVTYACHAVCLYILSDHKRGKAFSVAGSAVLWLLCMGLCAFAARHRNSGFYWFITNFDTVLMLTLFALTTSGPLAKSVFMVCTYGIYFYFTMIPCELTLRLLPSPWRLIPYAPVRIIMYVLLVQWWVRRGRGMFEKATGRIENRRWLLLATFSVTSLFSVTFVMTRLLMLNRDEGFWEYAISLCTLLVATGAYVLIIHLMAILSDEHENRMMHERERQLLAELNAQKMFVEQTRQNRHDLRHHNRLLLDFLDKGDTEGLRAYLAEYDLSLDTNLPDFFCENTVANAMIRHAKGYAEKAGFGFSCGAQIPARLPLSDTELCVLLGNLLENALEACRKCVATDGRTAAEKPGVSIRAKISHQKLYLSVQNSVSGTVAFRDGIPKSIKQNGGVGIRSVLTTLAARGGMASFSQEGSQFVAQAILPL